LDEGAFEHRDRQPTALETASYAVDMAYELMLMCERAGLVGLSALFYAAAGEAERAASRLTQTDWRALR